MDRVNEMSREIEGQGVRDTQMVHALPPSHDSEPADPPAMIDLAKRAMSEQPGGTIDDIVKLMKRRLDTDADLCASLMPAIIDVACRRAVHCERHMQFSKLRYTPPVPNPSKVNRDTARFVPESVSASLLDWVLSDKRPLGDHTGKELAAEVESCRGQSRGWTERADFFAALARKAGDRRVRDALSESELVKLYGKHAKTEAATKTKAVA